MAVASTMHNARCRDCGQSYYDPDEDRPCPRCRSSRIEALASAPPAQSVPSPAAYAAAHGAAYGGSAKNAPTKQASALPAARAGALVGLFALIFGGVPWLEGARTTRDGWVIFLNWVFARLHLPLVVPSATAWAWWAALAALIALGLGYSLVEIRYAPFRAPQSRRDFFRRTAWYFNPSWQAWLIWLVIIISDVVTMYLGALQAGKNDPAFLQQIAASARSAAIYAIIITFVPDRLVRWGWHRLRG